MKIAGIYSFNDGQNFVLNNFKKEIKELKKAIKSIDANLHETKESKEKTMPGKILFSPVGLNKAFKESLFPLGWKNVKEQCQYSNKFYVDGYKSPAKKKVYPYRDMDFVKNKLGVEVQFGKYSFMVYNVCAKMTIFKNLGHITAGVEVVPVKELAEHMSTGVSYFEQFVWDLEQRGTANIDIPVMIIGISA
ncbi:MAG: BglII/BstYI family type II restriction endonuclease [Ignavibacteriaceae bacterium]